MAVCQHQNSNYNDDKKFIVPQATTNEEINGLVEKSMSKSRDKHNI